MSQPHQDNLVYRVMKGFRPHQVRGTQKLGRLVKKYVVNKRRKSDVKIFFCKVNIVIFVLCKQTSTCIIISTTVEYKVIV